MPLAALDLLAGVEAALPAHLGGLHRLAVDVGDAGRLVPAVGGTDLGAQGVDELLPGAVLLPGIEVVASGALGEQVMGQVVPLGAGARLVEQGVEDLPHIDGAGPAPRLGRRDERPESFPLGVGEVGGIALAHGAAPGGWSAGGTPLGSGILGKITLPV